MELTEFITGHREDLLFYAATFTRTDEAAEDLVQDTSLRLCEVWDSFNGDSELLTWAKRIMLNLYTDDLRSRLDIEFSSIDDVAEDALACEDDFYDEGFSDETTGAFARLSRREKEVLLLSDVESRTSSEIAEDLDLSKATVKSYLKSARRKMRNALVNV